MTLRIENQRFGSLVAVARVGSKTHPNGRKSAIWRCLCDCGNTTHALASALKSGQHGSCGCSVRKHGATGTRTYNIWKNMIQRCTNPTNPSFQYYGARGITVCDRWLISFSDFLSDIGDIPAPLEIDRIDNDKGYEPGNCRIVDRGTNVRNSRPRHLSRTRNSLGQFEPKGEESSGVTALAAA